MDAGAVGRPPPEADISAHLRRHLERLAAAGRVEWRGEVRLLCYTHACRGKPDALRIDYLAAFDGGPLVGLEIKRRPDRPAELGRALFQSAQYAAGQVAAAQAGAVPQGWPELTNWVSGTHRRTKLERI